MTAPSPLASSAAPPSPRACGPTNSRSRRSGRSSSALLPGGAWVAAGPRFHTWALASRLLDEAGEVHRRDVGEGLEGCRLALAIAMRLSPATYPPSLRGDLRARALGGLADALRLDDRLGAARETLERAREALDEGSGEATGSEGFSPRLASAALVQGEDQQARLIYGYCLVAWRDRGRLPALLDAFAAAMDDHEVRIVPREGDAAEVDPLLRVEIRLGAGADLGFGEAVDRSAFLPESSSKSSSKVSSNSLISVHRTWSTSFQPYKKVIKTLLPLLKDEWRRLLAASAPSPAGGRLHCLEA